jgi:glycosyltransferase involved in cell wall biosynthesis
MLMYENQLAAMSIICYTWFPNDQNLVNSLQTCMPQYRIVYYVLSKEGHRTWTPPANGQVAPVCLAGLKLRFGNSLGMTLNLPIGARLAKLNPLLVIIRGWVDNAYQSARLFASKRHIPCIVWMPGRREITRRSPVRDRLARWFTDKLAVRVLKDCRFVFAYGSKAAADAVKLGVDRKNIVVVGITVDENHFDYRNYVGIDKAAFRKELGITDGPLFLTVAQLIRRKGISDLLQAFDIIRQKHKNVRLLLIGSGELRPLVEQYAREHKSGLVWLPSVPYQEIPKYYAIADCAVNPTLFDDWGNIVNESHCAMLPIISSDGAHSAFDLIKHEHSGLTYHAGNVGELAEMMEYAVQHPSQMRTMAKNGYDFIQSQWNSHQSAQIWAKYIRVALNGKGS